MKPTRLVLAPPEDGAAPTAMLFDASGAVRERRVLQLGEPAPAGVRTILATPGTDVAVHWLHLPTRNLVQARAAAALMLRDRLSLPDEDIHVAVGASEGDDHRPCVAVSKAALRRWLTLASLYGAAPDAVTPDCLLLPDPGADAWLACELDGRVAVRGPKRAFACDPEMLDLLLPDGSLDVVSAPEAVERLLAQGLTEPFLDLLQGAFAPAAAAVPPSRRRRLVALAAVAVAAPALVLGLETWRYTEAAQQATEAAELQANAVLPKGRPIGDTLAQARAHLAVLEAAAGGGPVGTAANLFAALEAIEGAQLETLIASPEGVRAGVSHNNYSDVELLREAMDKAGLAFREESTRDEGGRVMRELLVGGRL